MDLKYLNNEQIAAVLAKEQDILVLAGAGTGKTRVLTARVEYLLEQGVTPDEIVCFTFTNKAAREMKYRIRQAIGNEVAEQISISTFHSFFLPYLLPQLGYLGFTNEKIKIIKDNVTGYELERVYKVDLAILVLAVYELKFTVGVVPSIIINEAVELSKKYSTEKSYSFINGVLAKVVE